MRLLTFVVLGIGLPAWADGPRYWYPVPAADPPASYFTSLDGGGPKFRLIWLACGTEDRLIASHRKFESWLKEKGVPFSSKETPGAHTWMVWRRYLTDLAPLLFREDK